METMEPIVVPAGGVFYSRVLPPPDAMVAPRWRLVDHAGRELAAGVYVSDPGRTGFDTGIAIPESLAPGDRCAVEIRWLSSSVGCVQPVLIGPAPQIEIHFVLGDPPPPRPGRTLRSVG